VGGDTVKSNLISQIDARKRRLLSTYRKSAQFGLVLGAGVTIKSQVPSYRDLALDLLKAVTERNDFAGSREWTQEFIQDQKTRMKEDRVIIPPDELILYVRSLLGNDSELLRELVKKKMYGNVAVGRTAGRDVFESNTTLDSILTFCAACPNTALSPEPSSYKVEANSKIGGVLTTNYDNLIESAFHTKYRRNLLKPVGRPTTNEFDARERRTIPVYHMHGYIGYRNPKGDQDKKLYPEIVIAEDDYFETFYDPMGFGNYIALSFLRRFPCLFIGASMEDKNIRRILFHLYNAAHGQIPDHQQNFAILPMTDSPKDGLVDANLMSYGVETIWIENFSEIPKLLQQLYVNVKDSERKKRDYAEDWKYLENFTWDMPKRS
jgi:hypothetical protein